MKKQILALCAALGLAGGFVLPALAGDAVPVKVGVDAGVLVGETQDGVNVFKGVPFAKPPVGALRWTAPQPPEPWVGERLATSYESPCTQPNSPDPSLPNGGGVTGVTGEDCLYLQVYAPVNAKKAPVVVWMHGGAFFLGAGSLGSYDGTNNAKQGVITVPINYRMGALGFFSHPALTKAAGEDGDVGNFTILDAVEALEWVQRNIEQFGGDPDNVIIAGQSAGGVLVADLLGTPAAKGLFHKAVIQSGAFMGGGGPLEDAETKSVDALKTLGVSEDATLAQLRSISAKTLEFNTATQRGFNAVVGDRVLPVSPEDAVKAGTDNEVPVLVGSNNGERGFQRARALAELTGSSGQPAFLYRFDYVADFRKPTWPNGAIHSAELMYTFDSLDTSSWGRSKTGGVDETDREVAKRINSCWVAFYKSDVGTRELNCAGDFNWPAYEAKTDVAAQFLETPRVIKASTLPDGPES